jgi:hypothetical protein
MIMQTELSETAADPSDTTTKPKRRRGKAEHLTMEQVAERRMSDAMAAYRALVARAAKGEQLDVDTLEEACELLEVMGLPPLCWARDLKAHQDMAAAVARDRQLTDGEPARAERIQVITKRLEALEQEAKQLRGEHHELATVQQMRQIDAMRRQAELTHDHGHLFGELAEAVAYRLQAKHKPPQPRPEREPPQDQQQQVGWLS